MQRRCGLVVVYPLYMRKVPGSSPSTGINVGSKLRLHDAPQASYLYSSKIIQYGNIISGVI